MRIMSSCEWFELDPAEDRLYFLSENLSVIEEVLSEIEANILVVEPEAPESNASTEPAAPAVS
jgi:hypothetical protein